MESTETASRSKADTKESLPDGKTAAPWRKRLLLIILAGLITVIVGLTPIDRQKISDPRGTLLVSQSILQDRDVRLTEYAGALGPDLKELEFYHQVYWSENGEILFAYPIGNSLVSLPAVWVANLMGYDMLQPGDEIAVQRVLSPLTVGITFLLIFALSRIWLPYGHSLAWAAAMTLGTSISSTFGSALFSHNGLVIWLLIALILTFHPKCRQKRWCAVATGFCLFMGFISRGQGAFFIIALYAYLLVADWKRIPWVVLGSLPPLLLFTAWSWQVYGALVPGAYHYHGWGFSLSLQKLLVLYGHTFSPSRGFFIFSPFLLVLLIAAGIYWRKTIREKALIIPLIAIPIHFFVLSSWDFWWGGWSFGPRLIVDTMPAWALAGILIIDYWRSDRSKMRRRVLAGSFTVLALAASWINVAQGLHNPATLLWNIHPDHFEHPEVFWDWRFPQFLATMESVERQRIVYELAEIQPLAVGERATVDRKGVLLEGWHMLETGDVGKFHWADKGHNRITLFPELLTSINLAEPHQLQIWLGSYGPQAFTIAIGNERPSEFKTQTAEAQLFTVPIPPRAKLNQQGLVIKIESIEAKSPHQVEGSSDTRELGVRLHGLAISTPTD